MNRLSTHPARLIATIALAASHLGLGCGCAELTTPPPARCRADQHLSAGKCCGAGEDWVPARSRCVCVDPSVCATPASRPGAAEHAAAPASAPAVGQPCLGRWTGTVKSSVGDRGTVAVTVTPMTGGSLKRPLAASCGSVTERLRGHGGCWLKLGRCARNGPILFARGAPSPGSDCEDPVSVAIRCDAEGVGGYRRTEEGLRVTGKLKRTEATPGPPKKPAPKRKR